MSGRATYSAIHPDRMDRVDYMALHTYQGRSIEDKPSGYGTGERDRAREQFGDLAVSASIEQWTLGNSETPFRLCQAFKEQYEREEAEGVELPSVPTHFVW